MRHLSFFCILFLLPFVASAAEENKRIMEGLSMPSSILGQDVKYSIILPEGYFKSKKNYPVVYLLHGLGDNESSWLEYGRIAQIADQSISKREIIPMIFVIPQGFRNYYVNDYAGTFLYEDMFVKELVPFIDKTYRTIPDNLHRATMGYSMGGFGALMLPVRHLDVFSVSVPLSISVRTDEQYMVEDASEWNDQWGRLFGGVGMTGIDRITEYYKQYSPFHLLRQIQPAQLSHLKLYIDNGDDEETLCRSNEELHILLRDLNFPHEYRVRDGGHSFSYWRAALPNALHFISDSFEDKVYRGDVNVMPGKIRLTKPTLIQKVQYTIAIPPGYEDANRLYPTIYLLGNFDEVLMQNIAGIATRGLWDGSLPPMLMVFLSEKESRLLEVIIPEIELKYNARPGFRFRALIGLEQGGEVALENAMKPEEFTSCVLFDAPVDTILMRDAISANKSAMKRTWLLLSNTDDGAHFETNGMAHILLRDEDIYHEYRVVEGGRDDQIGMSRWQEALTFTSEKIHR